jgi:transcription elongation factor GreA
MTLKGYEAMKEELRRLKVEERPAVSAAIEEARAHGDLKENAEYHAAREKQSFNEGRVLELESKLALAEVIDPSKLSGEKVLFGATVTVVDCETDERTVYQIVGTDEADIKQAKISVSAPIARALIGQRVGEIVTVRSPKKGQKEYEIVDVSFV